jgi:hypothetical protein
LSSSDRLVLPILVLLAAIGVIILLFVTEQGIGITPDSTGYIRAARLLHDGHGLSDIGPDGEPEPLTHWPPLFPVVLSLFAMLGFDLIDGVRWFNAALFGASILLVGVIARRYARGTAWLPLAASFLAMVSIVMYRIYSQALSEPLFILLVTLGLFLLALHAEKPSIWLLLGASLAVSLGFLTRYAGVAYVLTGILWLLRSNKKGLPGKVRQVAIFTAVSAVPMALWMTRNLEQSGSTANRAVVFHPISAGFISSAATALSRWTLPWLALVFMLIAIAVWRRAAWSNLAAIIRSIQPSSIHLFSLSILVYWLVIIASISFLDRATSPDERILLPVYVASLILTVGVCGAIIYSPRIRRFIKAVAVTLLIFLAISYCARAGRWIEERRHDGHGYTSRAWKNSSLIAVLEELAPGTPIYTNGRDAIFILAGRESARIPLKTSPTSGLENIGYEGEIQGMLDRLRKENGVLVYFEEIGRTYYPSLDELTDRLPLELVNRTEDGWIYRAGTAGLDPNTN